jgi:hypothetical protein
MSPLSSHLHAALCFLLDGSHLVFASKAFIRILIQCDVCGSWKAVSSLFPTSSHLCSQEEFVLLSEDELFILNLCLTDV